MKIGIIGTGTAGILSIAFVLAYAPEPIEVYSIHNPKKPILGIGESTSTQIPGVLYDSIGFTLLENADELDATAKLGVKFSNWREQEFYSHIMPVCYGMHFDNHSIKEFTFKKFRELFKNFREIHGDVTSIETEETKAYVTVNDERHSFDYVIDCGGYPDDYSDYNLDKPISLNSCLVHDTKPEKYNYTQHVATPNGWMFGIPLQSRQSFGYLYNDTITSKDDAIENFKTYCNDIDIDKLREFKFKSYSANSFFDGRVLKNGNRALFYEPLEAFMGYFYERVLGIFFDYIFVNKNIDQTNNHIQGYADDIELAICFVYQGGSIYDTPFWDYAKKISYDRLNNDLRWQNQISEIQMIKRQNYYQMRNHGVGALPVKSWVDFDENLKYNMF